MADTKAMQPRDAQFQTRVADSFARQTIMTTIGATLTHVAPGEVDIALPFRADLCQQHGFVHAGVVTTIVDSACGFAALTLMPPGAGVLTIEFKSNFLAPAAGDIFIARGRVVRAGRQITVVSGEVIARSPAGEKVVSLMQATMIAVTGTEGVKD
jgi:uncharacterized protein (TIGR00369 family)